MPNTVGSSPDTGRRSGRCRGWRAGAVLLQVEAEFPSPARSRNQGWTCTDQPARRSPQAAAGCGGAHGARPGPAPHSWGRGVVQRFGSRPPVTPGARSVQTGQKVRRRKCGAGEDGQTMAVMVEEIRAAGKPVSPLHDKSLRAYEGRSQPNGVSHVLPPCPFFLTVLALLFLVQPARATDDLDRHDRPDAHGPGFRGDDRDRRQPGGPRHPRLPPGRAWSCSTTTWPSRSLGRKHRGPAPGGPG